MKIYTSVDMEKNELQNVKVHNSAQPPQSPVSGQIYYDTADASLKFYDAQEWKSVIVQPMTNQDISDILQG